jgi:hypothetical protein
MTVYDISPISTVNITNYTLSTYQYPFRILSSTDLVVSYNTNTNPNTYTTLTYLTHYTVTGANDANGGNILLTETILNDAAFSDAKTIVMQRVMPMTQTLSLQENQIMPVTSYEKALDKLTMIAQQTSVGSNYTLWSHSGMIQGLKPTYISGVSYSISTGSLDINGIIYTADAIAIFTPLNTTAHVEYIYVAPPSSGTILSFSSYYQSLTAPVYNTTKLGWYNVNDPNVPLTARCIGHIYVDSTHVITEFIFMNPGYYIFNPLITLTNNISTYWNLIYVETLTANAPPLEGTEFFGTIRTIHTGGANWYSGDEHLHQISIWGSTTNSTLSSYDWTARELLKSYSDLTVSAYHDDSYIALSTKFNTILNSNGQFKIFVWSTRILSAPLTGSIYQNKILYPPGLRRG